MLPIIQEQPLLTLHLFQSPDSRYPFHISQFHDEEDLGHLKQYNHPIHLIPLAIVRVFL